MNRVVLSILVVFAALAFSLAAGEEGGLVVTGRGSANVAPDQATVQLGVAQTARVAREAQEGVNSIVQNISQALADLGIPREKIQTSGLSLYPNYSENPPQERNRPPRIIGYTASYTMTARLDDLSKVGPVIDAALGAGANQLQGVHFGLENDKEARIQALSQAVSEARWKAEVMAQSAGITLGPLRELHEGGISMQPPQPMMQRAMYSEMADKSTEILPGQVSVEASVTLRYEIEAK